MDFNKLKEELPKQGFPQDVIESFFEALQSRAPHDKEYEHVIAMSRVPGKAATQLIAEGYDVKGFKIKAKSCDWGPMAGFLCKLPPFNKSGVSKLKSNYKSNSKYQKNYLQKLLFKELLISDKRKNQLLDGLKDEFNIKLIEKINDSRIYGLSQNKRELDDSSVIMEFILEKNMGTHDKIWKLYHGQVFIRQQNIKDYSINHSAVGIESDSIASYSKKNIDVAGDKVKIDNYRKKYDFMSHKTYTFYEIEGIINPEDKGEHPELSTVTGDYDLFAVWPAVETNKDDQDSVGIPSQSLLRISEKGYCLKKGMSPEKAFTSTIKCGNYLPIIIEFIPHFNQIESLEDPNQGNYNPSVQIFFNYLNGAIVQRQRTGNALPRAYHSDEGGRPGIKTLDLPIAVFHPFLTEGFLINTPYEFLTYCRNRQRTYNKSVSSQRPGKSKFYKHPIILNYAWLLNLFALIMAPAQWKELRGSITESAKDEFDLFRQEVKDQKSEGGRGDIWSYQKLYDAFIPNFDEASANDGNKKNRENIAEELRKVLFEYAFNPEMKAEDIKGKADEIIKGIFKEK